MIKWFKSMIPLCPILLSCWGRHGQIYVMGFWMLKASLDLASICLPDQSAAIQNSLERGWSFKKHYIWSHCFGMTKSHWAQQLSKDVDQVSWPSMRISHLMIGLWLFCRWRGDLDPEVVCQLTTWFSWTQPSRNDFNLYGEKIKLLYFTTRTPIFSWLCITCPLQICPIVFGAFAP